MLTKMETGEGLGLDLDLQQGTLMPSYPIDLLRWDDCGSVDRKRQAQVLSG